MGLIIVSFRNKIKRYIIEKYSKLVDMVEDVGDIDIIAVVFVELLDEVFGIRMECNLCRIIT